MGQGRGMIAEIALGGEQRLNIGWLQAEARPFDTKGLPGRKHRVRWDARPAGLFGQPLLNGDLIGAVAKRRSMPGYQLNAVEHLLIGCWFAHGPAPWAMRPPGLLYASGPPAPLPAHRLHPGWPA